MRTTKRKPEDETETNYAEKKKKKKVTISDDRLSNLPEQVQRHILSFLDAKDAVQTSVLSKSWVSLWTSISILELSSSAFKSLDSFNKFVIRILSARDQTAKLDKLTFNRSGASSASILKKVFDYAFSHGVKQLEASIDHMSKSKSKSKTNNVWPVCLHTSSDSMVGLKLHSRNTISHCPFLGSKSGLFKNLTDLNLKGAIIKDLDPFSGFSMLKKLTLINFHLSQQVKTLNVCASHLLELTISCYKCFDLCKLTTPKLRLFEYRGYKFPVFETHQGGLPDLETLLVGLYEYRDRKHKKLMFDDLLVLFGTFYNAKTLFITSSVVRLLSLFPDELMTPCSPFRGLNCLKLEYSFSNNRNLLVLSNVKSFLLGNSPEAEFSIVN